MAQVEWYRYEVYVDGASMGVACVWMARMWVVGDACGRCRCGVDAITLGSARGCCAPEGAQMHASGCGMGLVVRVPLGLSCRASEAR